MEMTRMMFAASSASGSSQYLFANTKHASASFTCARDVINFFFINTWIVTLLESLKLTLTRSRSLASMTVPWKNSTWVKWRLNKPSNSKSGSFLLNTPCSFKPTHAYDVTRLCVTSPVHDDQLNVDIFSVFVEEIGHEVGDGFVRDVAAQHDMSVKRTWHFNSLCLWRQESWG